MDYIQKKLTPALGISNFKPQVCFSCFIRRYTKLSKDYVYKYRNKTGLHSKEIPFNTAGWTSVEIAGKIIDKIGPILATKY